MTRVGNMICLKKDKDKPETNEINLGIFRTDREVIVALYKALGEIKFGALYKILVTQVKKKITETLIDVEKDY